MKFTLVLYCSWLMESVSYHAPRLEVELVPRSYTYLYESLWWELCKQDYLNYSNLYLNFDYLKIIDDKGEVQYSSKPLTPDELQDKIKSTTLENVKLE
jgi:hypothetical protein